MDEYIEREAVYEDFEKRNSENPKWTPGRVKVLIARQKTADVAPVVRCKDCKFSHADEHGRTCEGYWFELSEYAVSVKDDDFCSYGERREDA